jgi:hypothetical protein
LAWQIPAGIWLALSPALQAAEKSPATATIKLKKGYTALSLAFNTATALFGGTAPLLATYLALRTGDPCSPGLYLMVSAAVTVGVVCRIRETYREPLP